MKIVNVSYVHFPTQGNALQWIEESRFFKGIWEFVARKQEVHFFEFINCNEDLQHEGIFYHFKNHPKSLLRLPFRTNKAIASLSPDIVIVHGLLFPLQTILLKIKLGSKTKIVLQHHAERPFQNTIKRWLQKLAYHCVDAYFFTSEQMAQPWLDAGIIKSNHKVFEIMEIGSVFQPGDSVQARAITKAEGHNSFIWVGNLNTNKDPLLTLKAFISFIEAGNEAHLYFIYQSNDLLSEVKKLISLHPSVNNSIHLIGKVPHKALQNWYNSVDFIISSSRSEAGGVAVSEAMSCGCIPILSDIPSFKMMTQNVCGYLFPVGDEQALLNILINTTTINKSLEKERTLLQHTAQLSFKAIATKIQSTLINIASVNVTDNI